MYTPTSTSIYTQAYLHENWYQDVLSTMDENEKRDATVLHIRNGLIQTNSMFEVRSNESSRIKKSITAKLHIQQLRENKLFSRLQDIKNSKC